MTSVSKAQRQQVLQKSGGRCWYCGCKLPSRWHVDHCEPLRRGPDERPERHNIDNLVPACVSCNQFKSVLSLEQFRDEVALQVERARQYSLNFRTAERFGLVTTTGADVVFWFETQEVTDSE